MKLATLKDRTRDGMLVVVSRDLTRCVSARPFAQTLQAALDDWEHVAPRLADLAHDLELGAVPADRFHEHAALSPLPRAYQRIVGAAYGASLETDPAEPDASSEPVIWQAGSDSFLAPREPIRVAREDGDIDCAAEVAVVTGDVPMGATREAAAAAIRLVMLVNDVSLRDLMPAERARGCGLFRSKPPASVSPVAVTPDELGAAWDGGRLHLPLLVAINGKAFGKVNAGTGMAVDFPALIAHAAGTRALSAGTIVGTGPVSDRSRDGGPGRPVAEGGAGYACIAEIRSAETLLGGAPRTPFLRFGDSIRIEMKDAAGHSIFGAIEQDVEESAG